jgi:hypothetical protein
LFSKLIVIKTNVKFNTMKNILIALLFLVPVALFAQTKQEIAKEQAVEQIKQMKSGVLLVRLYDKHKVVEALKEKGMVKRAEAIAKKQEVLNKEIAASFKGFNFCKVYFFYSGHSVHLINGELEKVDLYEDDLILAKESKITTKYVIADFGMMSDEPETRTETKQKPESGISEKKTYKGTNTSTSIKTMYLRNSDLTMMGRPFPYYVRFHPSPIKKRTYQEVVDKMNEQLNDFYSSI